MTIIDPINRTKLFGLEKYFSELVRLYENNILPNKILLSGQKGIGKATLAYHFINYVLSKKEEYKYNTKDFEIIPDNPSFKTILNKSNPNFILLDIPVEKTIDLTQVRDLISNLNKTSLNEKPRFILIDNIEFLNLNSINALLKIIEEPSINIHFFLINNNKKILDTLLSRCINFNIFLNHKENLEIANNLLGKKLDDIVNYELINYYFTPGKIYKLVKFSQLNDYDLKKLELKNFLQLIIKNNHYKKDLLMKDLVFDFIELYLSKINFSLSYKINDKYNYFIKKLSDYRKYNLDEESFFIEFQEAILNG